jgi:hypothetical protein
MWRGVKFKKQSETEDQRVLPDRESGGGVLSDEEPRLDNKEARA